jgi:hypothetical protein
MMAYLPIVLGQDALQWLRHLPRHCIDDWSDFSHRFIANFRSLSNKPTQPWDLKSIRHQNDETLQSFLNRFQTMRNRIPEVLEATIIEDFYWDPTTRPSSESYSRKCQPPPNNCSEKRTSTSPRMNGPRTSSGHKIRATRAMAGCEPVAGQALGEEASRGGAHCWPPAARAHGAPHGGVQTLDEILYSQCPYHKDMRHTLRNCRDFKQSSGTTDRSSHYHLSCHEESLGAQVASAAGRGEGWSFAAH